MSYPVHLAGMGASGSPPAVGSTEPTVQDWWGQACPAKFRRFPDLMPRRERMRLQIQMRRHRGLVRLCDVVDQFEDRQLARLASKTEAIW